MTSNVDVGQTSAQPQAAITKSVVVHKPNVVEIPEGGYETAGDLVAAVGKKNTELLGSREHLTYTISQDLAETV
ncbi:MAG: hypothetical protein CMP47_14025 [Rickettsiales bacterium]|nr:hypothetical protein [Rickettsiales bacterium]